MIWVPDIWGGLIAACILAGPCILDVALYGMVAAFALIRRPKANEDWRSLMERADKEPTS